MRNSRRRGRLDASTIDERMQRLTISAEYGSLSGCDLVIEAVYEDLSLKQNVLHEVARVLPATAVLASNTSTLDLHLIAAAASRPQNVVGLHFFSPAHIMRLLEVVRGKETSPATLAAAPLIARLAMERASDIDVVYRNGYGFPAHRGGPLFYADSLGLDHILRSMATFRAGYEGWFWEPAHRLIDAARRGVRLTGEV